MTNDQGRGERAPLVATYHPALDSLGKVARRLHPMLTNSEEHRKVFHEPPLIAFRRCKNLMDIVRSSAEAPKTFYINKGFDPPD